MFFITYLCDLGHKSSHQSWINKLFIDVWFVKTGSYLAEMQLFENLESEGAKKSKYWQKRLKSCPNEVLSNADYLQKIYMEHLIF